MTCCGFAHTKVIRLNETVGRSGTSCLARPAARLEGSQSSRPPQEICRYPPAPTCGTRRHALLLGGSGCLLDSSFSSRYSQHGYATFHDLTTSGGGQGRNSAGNAMVWRLRPPDTPEMRCSSQRAQLRSEVDGMPELTTKQHGT